MTGKASLNQSQALWCGDGAPTPQSACDWFKEAFPVRDKAQRTSLVAALEAAFGEDKSIAAAALSDGTRISA